MHREKVPKFEPWDSCMIQALEFGRELSRCLWARLRGDATDRFGQSGRFDRSNGAVGVDDSKRKDRA